ncbi:MAG: TPM domain-containing protein, partial [Candidatus Acidiferrales bacterium]
MPIRLQSSKAARRSGYLAPFAAVCLVATFFAAAVLAQNPRSLRPQGYVNDFAHVLAPDSRKAIEALCQEVDRKAQAQIAVVTVRSLEGRSIEGYSIDLATRWGIGPKQKDRGVLILLAPNEHQYRIEVG